MENDFMTLWHAQTLPPHDAQKLNSLWKKHRRRNIWGNLFNVLITPPALWFAFYVANGEKHLAVKIWVLLCMGYGTVLTLVALWMSRDSFRRMRDCSNAAFIKHSIAQNRQMFRMARIHAINGVIISIALPIFLVVYTSTSVLADINWPHFALAALFVWTICGLSWWYGKRKMAEHQRILDWLATLQEP